MENVAPGHLTKLEDVRIGEAPSDRGRLAAPLIGVPLVEICRNA